MKEKSIFLLISLLSIVFYSSCSNDVNYKNEKLDEFHFNFFNDYPIEKTARNGQYIIPIRKGKGIIETSILPVSNSFFTYKRFQNK